MLNQGKFISFVLLACLGIFKACVSFAEKYPPLSATNHIPYKTFIFGVEDIELRNTLRMSSQLVSRQSSPPATITDLKTLAVQDLKNLQEVLAAQGYYDAEVDYFVDTENSPVIVYLKINLGAIYKLGAFKIKSDPSNDPLMPMISENIDRLGIHVGMPANKDKIKTAVDQIMRFLKDRGKPLAKVKENRIVVDRAAKEMHVALLIASGPLVRFGNLVIENSGGIKPEFIKSKLAWQKGDIYNREKIIQTIQKLHNSRIFKTIKISNAEAPSDDGFLDIHVHLTGAPPNQYIVGADYQAKMGLVGTVQWESHNALEHGEILNLSTHMGSKQKTIEGKILVPDFQTINLDFVNKIRAGRWNFPAFGKQGMEVKSSLAYPIFGPEVVGKAGASFEILNVSKGGVRENTYRILGLPLGIKYSDVEGDWQPRKGVKVKVKAYPYVTLFGKMKTYARFHFSPQIFYPITKSENVVLTAWADAGFTPGAGKSVVPAHKLYYLGGARTVRGYKFQMAGPLDPSTRTPLGGRSMLLLGVGASHYVSDLLTLSGYMDWGTSYDRQYSDFSNGMLWGIGAGVTYHSGYGDFRFDIASPVKRRSVDNAIEFYLSFSMKPYEVYQGLYRKITPPSIQNSTI